MHRSDIYKLSQVIPRDTEVFSDSPFQILAEDNVTYETEKFARCYSNPSFVWHFVKLFAKMGEPLPITSCYELLTYKGYNTILEAYNFIRYGTASEEMVYAVSIDSSMNPYNKNVLRGTLLVEDVEAEHIARKTGVPLSVIEIYEELFFNVWDRQEDQLFIASLVNPEGAFAELNPNYQARASYGELLRRTGYKYGLDDVMSLAGVRGHEITGSTQNIVAEFENKLMANALFLANTGFMNTRNNVGISNAKNLLAAAKHGGDTDTAQNDNIGIGGIADVLAIEVKNVGQIDAEGRRLKNVEYEEAKLDPTT
jgi:hypothetical protein